MAKKQSKKKLVQKWNEKISNSEKLYKEVRKENKSLPGWEKSDIYKAFRKKKQRALKRYERADEINYRKRELYRAKKEAENVRDEFTEISEVSVFEAYTGNGREFEDNIRKIVRERNSSFYGEIFIDNKKDSSFADINRYSFRINAILRKIFDSHNEKKSLSALSWRVKRSYFYDVANNHMFVTHEFLTPK